MRKNIYSHTGTVATRMPQEFIDRYIIYWTFSARTPVYSNILLE